MTTMRFALIGCGSIAGKHIAALSRIPDARIVAVCDSNPEAAKAVAERCGAKAYGNAETMAEAEDFDVFTVLTPSGNHADQILSLARFNRHFVVEKPMALRIEDADAMIAACDHSCSKIFVVKQNRYNPPIIRLRQALEAGRFGKLVMGTVRVRWARHQHYYDARPWRGTWAQDGGVLTNQAGHHIDMLLWMMGEVESVTAMTATRLARMEAEDTGVALLRFASGALGVIEATTAARPKDLEGSISILGENGSVEVGGFFMNELKSWEFIEPADGDSTVFETHGVNPKILAWNHEQYLRGVIAAIRNNHAGLVDGLEGRKSLEVINAFYESAETGRQVPLRFHPLRCRLGQPVCPPPRVVQR